MTQVPKIFIYDDDTYEFIECCNKDSNNDGTMIFTCLFAVYNREKNTMFISQTFDNDSFDEYIKQFGVDISELSHGENRYDSIDQVGVRDFINDINKFERGCCNSIINYCIKELENDKMKLQICVEYTRDREYCWGRKYLIDFTLKKNIE